MGALKNRLIYWVVVLPWSLMGLLPGELSPDSAFASPHDGESRDRLSQEREGLLAAHGKERDLLAQLAGLEQDVSAMRRSIQERSLEIERGQAKAREMEKALSELERSKAGAETRMAERLVVMYKYARYGYLAVIVNAEDLHEFSRRAAYARAVTAEDLRVIDELALQKADLERRTNGIRSQIAEREASMRRERLRVSELREALDAGVLNLIKIRQEKVFYETAVRELQSASAHIGLMTPVVPAEGGPAVPPDSRFADFKGRLSFPLKGQIVRARKFLKRDDSRLDKGIFIEASDSTDVRAVFPGRIEFSGTLKGYGEVVIINHGSRFYTISAFLSRRKKEKGDEVEMGEWIGTAGRGGAEGVRLLYFEIREGERSLDPVEWLAVA